MKALRIVPANTNIPFIATKWPAFILSFFLILGTCYSLVTKGLNFGIDFTGGIVIELRSEEPTDVGEMRAALSTLNFGEVSIQNIGSPNDVLIRTQGVEGSQSERVALIKEKLAETFLNNEIEYRKVDYVGPVVGQELIESGLLALGLAIVAILVYISIRFEWQYGVGAVIALLHDLILTLGLYSVMQLEFNLTSIAAVLTIIGYSINDSVVIFDRIRETMRKYMKKPVDDVLNRSINDTLSRTILTAGTTVLALVALVVYGGPVIYGFSLAVLFGVIIGTYSSIYVAAPVLTFMRLR